MSRTTVITNFYNDEYLLPWWVKQHREMFDDAILIDWNSTDNSVGEIKKHAPASWKIVKKRNLPLHQEYASMCEEQDLEVMQYEAGITGWRICLNTTEFMVGDLESQTRDDEPKNGHHVHTLKIYGWNPEGQMSHDVPLWDQQYMGIDCRCGKHAEHRSGRSLHNFTGSYGIGRHLAKPDLHNICRKLLLLHYGECLTSPQMIKRRLQIQNGLTQKDRRAGMGWHHIGDEKHMKNCAMQYIPELSDVRPVLRALQQDGYAPPCNPHCSETEWNVLYRP